MHNSMHQLYFRGTRWRMEWRGPTPPVSLLDQDQDVPDLKGLDGLSVEHELLL